MRIIPTDPDIPGFGTIIPTVNGVASDVKTTQTAQAEDGATMQIAQATFMPPLPIWTALIAPNGMATPALAMWGQELQRRIGPYASNPTTDAELQADFGSGGVDQEARAMLQDLQLVMDDGGARAFAVQQVKDSLPMTIAMSVVFS